MIWVFALLGLVAIVVIGLVVVGQETHRLAGLARPAIFDLAEAVDFIADRLPTEAQGRLTHEDVRWILLCDADLLEEASSEPEGRWPWSRRAPVEARSPASPGDVVDQDMAVARILRAADEADREIADPDVAEVLDLRLAYLEAIGAVGGRA